MAEEPKRAEIVRREQIANRGHEEPSEAGTVTKDCDKPFGQGGTMDGVLQRGTQSPFRVKLLWPGQAIGRGVHPTDGPGVE